MSPAIRIRPASTEDIERTVEIEAAADVLLIERFSAVGWPPPADADADERRHSPGFILVAETDVPDVSATPVGFVQVLEVHGFAHLEQVSVLPEYAGRGVGRLLLGAALDETARRGYRSLSLRTYAEVPWNAPFYLSCGFLVTSPTSGFHRSLVDVEKQLGIDAYGVRVQMTADLESWQDSHERRL